MLNKVEKDVARFISQEDLMVRNGKYIVALSGGADSVCLLIILKRLGYNIEAVHCNFHLRGTESERDEHFCIELCEKQVIPLHRIHFDTKSYAELHKISIEMAARQLRYAYFTQLRKDLDASGICVAHHQDDSIETFLLNIIRGTGIKGMRGILPQNGHVLRPLLCLNRTEIETYLQERHQAYVIDSTNQEATFMRNRIRLEIIPLLQTINSGVRGNILDTVFHVREAYKVYEHAMSESASQIYHNGCIDLLKLRLHPSPESLLYHILAPVGFMSAQIRIIAQTLKDLPVKSGLIWHSKTHVLITDRTSLLIRPKSQEPQAYTIPEEGHYQVAKNILLCIDRIEINESFVMDTANGCVCLDAQKVQFPLTLRTVRPGDRFRPLGMSGSKLLSDFMTDLKFSLFEKWHQQVLVDADEHIVWVVNHRISHLCRVTPETKVVLRCRWEEKNDLSI